METRRGLIRVGAAAAAAALAPFRRTAVAAPDPKRGPRLGPADPAPFSFEGLTARAKALSLRPYQPPPPQDPLLKQLDFDAFEAITYDPAMTLFGDAGRPAVRLFPLGRQFTRPVAINVIEDGAARPVIYAPALFRAPASNPIHALGRHGGFSGFRVLNPGQDSDWLAFLGASYFRTAGPFNQYGASARGLAINSGGSAVEEFPDFTAFWLEPAADGGLLVYALLESPSVAGAFQFDNRRSKDGVHQEVRCALFFRRAVETLGVAPITSMFWYGEDTPPQVRDWRPEVHDSDGLALWTGAGERIWRPLSDPPHVITNAFADRDPRGYGLMQRDRSFDHYQDDGAFYDRRPDVFVQPRSPFGAGSVRLVELPTEKETDDNIGAFWTPDAAVKAGDERRFNYRIDWIAEEPGLGSLARVVATRTGVGGRPGMTRPKGARRVAIDFTGSDLKGLDRLHGVEAVVTSPSGAKIEEVSAYGVVGTDLWRVLFDVEPQKEGPVDLRAFLRGGGKTLSETWLYQLF